MTTFEQNTRLERRDFTGWARNLRFSAECMAERARVSRGRDCMYFGLTYESGGQPCDAPVIVEHELADLLALGFEVWVADPSLVYGDKYTLVRVESCEQIVRMKMGNEYWYQNYEEDFDGFSVETDGHWNMEFLVFGDGK